MKLPLQLINLLGIVVTVAIVVAGVALIALPFYSQSQTTAAEAHTVAQTNDVYAAQVAGLEEDSARMPEILANVDGLRVGIPAQPKLDDVHEVVNAAATASGGAVVSVVAVGPDPWAPRTQIGQAPAGDIPAPPPAPASDPAAPADTSVAAPTDPAATAEAVAAPAETTTDGDLPPQRQVTVTITAEVPDATAAAAFLETLRAGPRLIGIETAVLTATDDGPLELVVTATAFVRTET